MAQTSYGTITITDTTDIESIVVEYAQNQDPLTAPINGWGTTRPEWAEGYYIWQRTRTHKYGTSSSVDDIGVAVCITGSQGETGRSLTSTTTQYTTAASSATITTDNMGDYIWYTNIPPYNSSTPVYWVRVTNIYSNPSTGYLDVYSGEVVDGSSSSNGSNSSSQNNSENNITTVYIIYKDEGLSSAVSMSQTALIQSSTNINSITRLWYRSNSATAPSAPSSHITESRDNIDNTWTTSKPIDKDGYRYYYYCDEKCTGNGTYSWSNVLLDTSNLSQYEIGLLTAKIKNFWWDGNGAHAASGKNGNEVDKDTISTYGYNSLMGLNGISFGYDNTKVVELNSNTPALNFYSPPTITNNTITALGKKIMQLSGTSLTFYNPSNENETHAQLSPTGLLLREGGIQSGSVNAGNNGFIYLSTKDYGTALTIGDGINKTNWRQIIGTKFGVDSEGNLYANNAHLSSANVEGAITATSLTIGSGADAYDGAAAINISGYDIEIEKNGIDEVEGVSVYLYPILYHNGVQVPTIEVDYSHFIWYQDDDTIGTEGDGENSGRYLATYGHNYRVIYDFDDGAVGGGTEVVDRTIDPSKYITKISDTGITIHPEVWSNQSSYIQLDGTGMELFNSNGNSIAHYGSTARVGLNNSSRFLINSNSLQAYDSNNIKYFEVSSSGLTWGSQAAATTQQVSNLSSQLSGKANTSDVNSAISDLEDAIDLKADSADVPTSVTDLSDGADYSTTSQMNTAIGVAETRAAKTATNYISMVDNNGITIHSNDNNNERNILINGNEISIRNGLLPMMTLDNDSLDFNIINAMSGTYTNVASFGSLVRVGKENNAPKVIIQDDDFAIYTEDGNIAFETNVPIDAPTTEQEIIKTYTESTYHIDGAMIETSSSYISSNTIAISDVTTIPVGTNFTLRINLISDSRWTTDYGECEFYFIRGTSSTQHDSVNNLGAATGPGVDTSGVNCSLSVQYNGSNTFVITGSYVLANTNESTMFQIDGYVSMLVYTAEGVPIPSTYVNGDFYANGTNIGSSYIMGACYLKQSVLAQTYCYLGLDYWDIPVDIALYDAINELKWNDDVIIEIIASPSADIILVGGTATTNTYTNPSGKTVYWKSSNNNVATVSANGLITGIGVGDVIITAYMYVNDIVVSTSFSMEVRTSYPT